MRFPLDKLRQLYYNISCKVFRLYTKIKILCLHKEETGDIVAKDLKYATLLDIYGDALTEKQRDVMDLYYNEDLSLSEIAANEEISRQGVRDSIKRGEETLSELDDKIGVVALLDKYNTLLDAVNARCDEIISDCKSYTTTKSVIEKLEKIKADISANRR